MDTKVSYTIVGLFVLILGSALVVMFFWLSQIRQDKVYNIYLVYMHEEVTGLSVQSPVRFNGVRVGYVDKIELDPSNPQLVRLMLKIEQGTPVTTSTVAMLMPQGITGIAYIGLKAETVDAPLLKAKPGQRYPVIAAKPSLLMQLSTVIPKMTKKLEKVSDSIQDLLNKKNRVAISDSLQNISKFTKTMADNSENLTASMQSLRVLLKNASTASSDLPAITQQVKATLSTLHQTSIQITRVTKTLNSTLRDGKVAMQNFSDQVMPETQQVMQRLNNMTTNLSEITSELQRNPSMLIRGKQLTPPGPGEK